MTDIQCDRYSGSVMTHNYTLEWKRLQRGEYQAHDATDPEGGNRWFIRQWGSYQWAVFCNGEVVADWPTTLHEAKHHAEDEVRQILDPAYRERVAERRRRRRERETGN